MFQTTMTTPQKICPACGMHNPIQAGVCGNCAHAFRTQFTPPMDQTQVFIPPPVYVPAPYVPAASKRPPFFLLFSVIGGLFVVILFVSCAASLGKVDSKPGADNSRPFTNTNSANITSRIEPGMNLADVLNIAGGFGKIAAGGRPENWMRMDYANTNGVAVVYFSFHGMADTEFEGKPVQMPIWIVERSGFSPAPGLPRYTEPVPGQPSQGGYDSHGYYHYPSQPLQRPDGSFYPIPGEPPHSQ